MNLKYKSFVVIITIFSHFCIASKFNKSLSDYEGGCNVGQNDHFFEVSSVNKNLKNNMERLHLKFYIMAAGFAIIKLSEVDNIWLNENKNRGYDIGLGSESWIANSSGQFVHERDSLNLFSEIKPKPVEIIITNDNKLVVNIPGYSEPFMKYSDAHSVNIKFFSFDFSNKNSNSKWFYNCTFDENSNVEDQKMPENEVKIVETKKTNVNQQQLCEPKSTAKPTEKNNEEQLTSKLSAIDSCLIKLKEYFWSETGPFNKHNSFLNDLSPILDNFDVNQMLDFKLGVLELIKKLKNPPTTTTKKPVAIDVRIGNTEESSCSCS